MTCNIFQVVTQAVNEGVNDRGKPLVDGHTILDKKYFTLFNDDYSRRIKEKYGISSEENVFTTKPIETKAGRADVYGYSKTYQENRWFFNEPFLKQLEKKMIEFETADRLKKEKLEKVVALAQDLESIAAFSLKSMDTVEEALSEIADQLKASPSEAVTARNSVGNEIANIALELFPQIASDSTIKPGVPELFEANPELANAVYKALGFKDSSLQPFKDSLINIIGVDNIKKLYAGTDVQFNSFIIDEVELGTDKDLIITIKTDKGQRTAINLRLDGDYQQLKISEGGKTIRGIYAPLSEKKTAIDFLISEFKNLDTQEITPQQKQQALQLYSQYLEQNPNGSIEQFKSWVDEFNNKKRTPLQPNKEQLKHIKPLPEKLIEQVNSWKNKSNKEILETLKLYAEVYAKDKELENLIQILIDNVDKIKFVKFKGIGKLENNNHQAEYDGETGEIFVNNIMYQPNNRDIEDRLYRTIIHEYLHGYFLSVLNSPTTTQEKELVEYINEAYDVLTFEYEGTEKWYGFSNVDEFVSELLSNKEFRESEQVKKTGIIQKILNFINQIFFKKYGKNSIEIKQNTFNKILENISILEPSLVKYSSKKGSLSDFISQKFQEKLNQIKDVFNENPELSSIGTPQQYSQYLDTIFPNSKVKDIVYHGSHTRFDKFDKSLSGSKTKASINGKGFFFSNSLAVAQGYRQSLEQSNIYNDIIFYYYFKRDLGNKNIKEVTKEEWQDIVLNYFGSDDLNIHYLQNQSLDKTKQLFEKFKNDKQFDEVQYSDELDFSEYLKDDSIVYSVILNAVNPLVVEGNNYQMLSIVKKEIEKLKEDNDSIVFNNVEDGISGGYRGVANTYTVFEPEQIHRLGTKQDIEGFKAFAQGTSEATETNVDIQEALQDFRNENSNMPDEDIDDYFFSCEI